MSSLLSLRISFSSQIYVCNVVACNPVRLNEMTTKLCLIYIVCKEATSYANILTQMGFNFCVYSNCIAECQVYSTATVLRSLVFLIL